MPPAPDFIYRGLFTIALTALEEFDQELERDPQACHLIHAKIKGALNSIKKVTACEDYDSPTAPDDFTLLAFFKIAKFTLQELDREVARLPSTVGRPFHLAVRKALTTLTSIKLPPQ